MFLIGMNRQSDTRDFPDAEEKIVFDRFHVMRQVLGAVDKVRKSENQTLLELGKDTLKGTKYLWLWSQENIPDAWPDAAFLVT